MDKINEFLNILRDFYSRFSGWVNSSPDANVIAWVSTVCFSAFAIFIFKMTEGIINRFFRQQVPSHEEQITVKETNTQVGKRTNATLNTYIPPAIDLIGREKDVENIYSLLEENNIVYIRADGGVGKTALATRIINDIRNESLTGKKKYEYVIWITSTENFMNDITGLGIPGIEEARSLDEKFKLVCTFLDNTAAFLVIDNMNELQPSDDVNKLNTLVGRTKFLITTRAKLPIGKRYELKDLDPDSALILFYSYFEEGKNLSIEQVKKRKDCDYAQRIVREASYNTLFIELIAKMVYTDHWKLDSLWKELEKDVFSKDSKHMIPTGHGYGRLQDQIQNLYMLSKLSVNQKELMSFIALFPAEHSIFFDAFKWAGLEDDEVDNLGELQKRGWIERSDEGYLIHTIVKGSVEQQQGKVVFDEERYEELIDKLADTDKYMPKDMVYSKVREYIVVPETICQFLIGNNSKQKRSSTLYHNLAGVYRDQGDYDKALEYYEKSREIKEKVLGKDHRDTATTYNNMAGVYRDQGDYDKALVYYEKSREIREKILGKDHPSTAITYGNMAGVYRDQGDYDKGLEYYEKSREIQEKLLGKDHPSTAITYGNMAGVYRDQGDYDKALEYYEKALEVFVAKLGEEHPYTKTVRMNMGSLKNGGN